MGKATCARPARACGGLRRSMAAYDEWLDVGNHFIDARKLLYELSSPVMRLVRQITADA